MTKNYIFRKFECELTKEETAKLCFKTVRTVTGWDAGNKIPPECRRLMRMVKGRLLCQHPDWEQFRMVGNKLQIPTGQMLTSQQILTAAALLEIESVLELETKAKIGKYVRLLTKLKIKEQQ
ncbi:regulator [Vibrio fluvialis]